MTDPNNPSVSVGDHVIFVDDRGRERDALITAIHGAQAASHLAKDVPLEWTPSVNLVAVHADEENQDQYGRQLWRDTSIVHKSAQPAHGMYWRLPEE